MDAVQSTEQLAEAIRDQHWVRVVAGGTKPAANRDANLSLAALTGVTEYNASEFTITVRAGTRLDEINQLLAAKKQYFPFDPPLVEAGATIGGTVASGLSGSGRFRFGGVRDFLLGVTFVAGGGQAVQLGSRVVKNAAGFDFPKLMVGSLGQFGVMTELTLKVFPAPEATATLVVDRENVPDAIALTRRFACSPLDLSCLDVDCDGRVSVRLSGSAAALESRVDRVRSFVGSIDDILYGGDDAEFWRARSEFTWVRPDHCLVKAAVSPETVRRLYDGFDGIPIQIAAGGHLAWIAWPNARPAAELDQLLRTHECPGLALSGDWANPLIGKHFGATFADRLRQALDPHRKFVKTAPSAA